MTSELDQVLDGIDLDEPLPLVVTPEGERALREFNQLRSATLSWLRAIGHSDEYPLQISSWAIEVRSAIETGKPCGADAMRWLERECRIGGAPKRRWAQHALETLREHEDS